MRVQYNRKTYIVKKHNIKKKVHVDDILTIETLDGYKDITVGEIETIHLDAKEFRKMFKVDTKVKDEDIEEDIIVKNKEDENK